jgi:hypothetical protein
MATTEAAVLDRIRDVMASLEFTEAPWDDFSKTSAGAADRAFAIKFSTGVPNGQIGYYEEVNGTAEIHWLRLTNDSQVACRAKLLTDVRSILSAVVRDGTAGGYAVDDGGQRKAITWLPGGMYGRGEIAVPLNFEAAL